ncbi:MAG TPA: FAD-dependent oxidoreductase [Trichocoleus sp.]|jgi:hypothetical protein
MNQLKTEVLVVGGGTGGTAAAIQSARSGVQTVLVSEFPWLGGMLTTAGVTAPDGNELAAWQTGLWGAFLQELRQRQPGGLDHAWVSFFTYEPRISAAIFADWVKQLPNLIWIQGQTPQEVIQKGDRITGVRFQDWTIEAKITIDGTELGDLLALAEVPYRWGWEWRSDYQEPSAPIEPDEITEKYAVQAPTWVFVMQDFGEGSIAPEILVPPQYQPDRFIGTWTGYGAEMFLNYGRLPKNRFMLNFPQQGNDYGIGVERLVGTMSDRQAFLQEAFFHAQGYAHFLQAELGGRYGLATDTFPEPTPKSTMLGGKAFALHPYYRESRRLLGLTTIREQDILPIAGGRVAALPINPSGQVESIALGSYANDHHYPGYDFPLQPKSIRWGGRWTGTPFTIPYRALIPVRTEGLLVCEKNISVSHIANGATRLQPVVLGIGQAAGMAAALSIQQNCQPQELPVRLLQEALLQDPIAPAAVIPLFNVPPDHPHWLSWQRYFLEHPGEYGIEGVIEEDAAKREKNAQNRDSRDKGNAVHPLNPKIQSPKPESQTFVGIFQRSGEQDYQLQCVSPEAVGGECFQLVTLHHQVDRWLHQCGRSQKVCVRGQLNRSGRWILVEEIESLDA